MKFKFPLIDSSRAFLLAVVTTAAIMIIAALTT